jgi:hypothetical protein
LIKKRHKRKSERNILYKKGNGKGAVCLETKVCNKCGIEKELKEFHKKKGGRQGVKAQCKTCVKTPTKSKPEKTTINIEGVDYIGTLKASRRGTRYIETDNGEVILKVCTKCYKWKPFEAGFSNRSKGVKGKNSKCRDCDGESGKRWRETNKERHSENGRIWYEKNKERRLETSRKWQDENKERISENHRKWYEKNKEHHLETGRKWREENKERYLENQRNWREENRERQLENQRNWYEKNKERQLENNRKWQEENRERYLENNRKWREENRERYLENSRKWREENRERISENQRTWRLKNPEKVILKDNRRRSAKKALPDTLTSEQIIQINQRFPVCPLTGSELNHLEHFIPLSWGTGGGTSLTNCYYLDANMNFEKHNTNPFTFFTRPDVWKRINKRAFIDLVAYLAAANKMNVAEFIAYVYFCDINRKTDEEIEEYNARGEKVDSRSEFEAVKAEYMTFAEYLNEEYFKTLYNEV